MDIIWTILSVLFVVLLLGTALTFGFALLVWFIGTAVVFSVIVLLREWWRRWRFLRNSRPPEKDASTTVIEVEYEDITNKYK